MKISLKIFIFKIIERIPIYFYHRRVNKKIKNIKKEKENKNQQKIFSKIICHQKVYILKFQFIHHT